MNPPVRLLLVGAGQRGVTYARRAEKTGAGRIVAVADPDPEVSGDASAGHGDGDDGLVDAFLAAVATVGAALIGSDAATSLAGHRVVWAAERARLSGTVVTPP